MIKTALDFDKTDLLDVYEKMYLLRKFEEKAGQLYGMKLIGGFCHLYIGQEAVAIGIQKALVQGDSVITSYRDHGFILAAGGCPNQVMAELLGREAGCSKGKGGSMHMFDVEKGFYGGHGIVGAQVSIGTGIGFAHKYKEKENISVTIFGDGACHQGQVYESFNMAKLWGLPVLYVIENNEYAMGTSIERSSSIKDLYKRGESFGIPGKQVDGMDFFNVYSEVLEAADYIRKNQSPFLLEIKTYRYRGHSMSDPGNYRTKDEVEHYKKNLDPITAMKNILLENKFSDKDIKDVESKIKARVKESVEFAEKSPEPNLDTLYDDVFNK